MTSSLANLARDVRSEVERLSRKDELVEQILRLGSIDTSLSALDQQARETLRILDVARLKSFAPVVPSLEAAQAAVERLVHQGASGDLPLENATAVDQTVRDVLQELGNSLVVAWRDYVLARVPAQDGLLQLAEALSEIEGVGVSANRLHTSLMQVQSLLNLNPSQEAVARLDTLAFEIPELVQALVGDDPEVKTFAEQLAAGGAGLEKLTAAVQKWMDERTVTGSFKIVPGHPGQVGSA